MSLDVTLVRIAQLQSVLAPVPVTPSTMPSPPSTSASGGGPAKTPFASVLQEATKSAQSPVGRASSGIAALAAKEVGQREAPMGSNDSA